MRNWIIIIVIFVSLFLAQVVRAQGGVVIERLQVDLWPEYDRPDVLVIYRITLAAETTLPAKVTLRIPREVVKPYNVAMQDVDSLLYNLEYTSVEQGEWLAISFTAASPRLQLEYYDPRIKRTATQRDFDYIWSGDYAVRSLNFHIQQPFNAKTIKLQPEMGSGIQEQDGLLYYNWRKGLVNAGETFNVHLNYDKPDDVLSISLRPVEPSQPIPQPNGWDSVLQGMLPWLLVAGLGMVVWAGWAWNFWRSKQTSAFASSRRRRGRSNLSADKIPAPNGSVFCHKCGKQSQTGDVFCRGCGVELRRE